MVLRLVTYRKKKPPAEAEIYTLSTDSWRTDIITMESLRGNEPNFGSIVSVLPPSVFCNGALHFIAYTCRHHYIFVLWRPWWDRPWDNDASASASKLFTFFSTSGIQGIAGRYLFDYFSPGLYNTGSGCLCHFWVMEEYGVLGSWTRNFLIPMDSLGDFYGCTDSGEFYSRVPIGWFQLTRLRV